MTEKEIKEKFISNPKYLKNGAGWLAEKFGTDPDTIRKIRFEVRNSIIDDVIETVSDEEITEVSDTTVVQNVNLEKDLIVETRTTEKLPETLEEVKALFKIDDKTISLLGYQSKATSKGFSITARIKILNLNNSLEAQKDNILKEIRDFQTSSKLLDSYNYFVSALDEEKSKKEGKLLEISIPDLHFGKLSHSSETGEDYDIKIASERFKTAIKELLKTVKLDDVERIVFPIGNDLINIDNDNNMTTSGTPQDCDSRFFKMVTSVKHLLVETIQGLSAIAPVDIVIVRGNHDATISFLIGEILEGWFHNHDNITVNNSPKWRKYYRYGDNSFMYTHGDKESHRDLGLIFATEEAQLWANTKYRFVKLGHLHKQKKLEYLTTDSYQGFQVEILPSLSGMDAWHYSKGYLGNKQAKAFLYSKTAGEIASYTYTV